MKLKGLKQKAEKFLKKIDNKTKYTIKISDSKKLGRSIAMCYFCINIFTRERSGIIYINKKDLKDQSWLYMKSCLLHELCHILVFEPKIHSRNKSLCEYDTHMKALNLNKKYNLGLYDILDNSIRNWNELGWNNYKEFRAHIRASKRYISEN